MKKNVQGNVEEETEIGTGIEYDINEAERKQRDTELDLIKKRRINLDRELKDNIINCNKFEEIRRTKP
jgi:hypothetical protein